jgi:predicted permease
MLNNFLFTINNVTPVFIIIFIGYFIRRKNYFSKEFFENMSKLVFNLALPALVFNSIYKSDFYKVFDLKLVSIAIFGTLFLFFILFYISKIFIKDNKTRGVFVQGGFRSNFVIIGLPLISNLFSDEGLSKATILVTFVMPLYNVLATVVLSVTSDDGKYDKKLILYKILKNPLIIAAVLALPFSIGNSYGINTQIAFLSKVIEYLAAFAVPLALIDIGYSIDYKLLKGKIKVVILAALTKLFISPILFLGLGFLAGLKNDLLGIIFIMSGSPTAVSSYIMAKAMKSDGQSAASIVILSTLLSLGTIFIGVYILKNLSVI